jgi:release factor glutamine methyltransferase
MTAPLFGEPDRSEGRQEHVTGADVARAVAVLQRAGVLTPEVDARWIARLAPPSRFGELVAERARRRPLQHVLGTVVFRHLELLCDERAMVPRPETEVTAGLAIEALRLGAVCRCLDLGTGAGPIALSIAHEVPATEVVATDISPRALSLAAANAARCGLSIDLRLGDLFEPVAGERFDVIVANPPYLAEAELADLAPEVRDHDPREALVAGPLGREVLSRILSEAQAHLREGGTLIVEISPAHAGWARGHGQVHKDLTGRPRVLRVTR